MKLLPTCIVQTFTYRILFCINNARNTSSVGRYNLSNGYRISYNLASPGHHLVIDEIFQLLNWSTENFIMQMDYFGGNIKITNRCLPISMDLQCTVKQVCRIY